MTAATRPGEKPATRAMDSTLAVLEPGELEKVSRLVDAWESRGYLSSHYADEWRRRIVAWVEFHRLGRDSAEVG